MAIRQQLIWDEKEQKYIGFCDYGNSVTLENKDIEATEALVFMLLSLKRIWKWPIAYFFKHAMSATVLSELIKTALILTAEAGLRIRAVTCDGDSSNCSALKILDANIFDKNYKNLRNFFPHVTMNHNVHVLLDAYHMLKLARNAIADYKELKTENEGLIKWQYITELHTLQNKLTFKLKNRLSSQCVYWKQNKMKVKYAAHTLSSSVANAIQFLKEEEIDQFKDSDSTIEFIRIIDRLFDFLNSRNPFAKRYKKPIYENNIPYLRNMIEEHTKYLFSLRTKEEQPLHYSGRKTFIYGLAIAAKSVLDVAEDLFKENKSYKYILTYKFSQDYLEIFFSKIRSRHSHNNNPNVFQFKNAIRQLLLRNDIYRHSTNANCVTFDTDCSSSIFPFEWKKKKQSISDKLTDFNTNYESEDEYVRGSLPDPLMKKLNEYIMYYLCGYIVKKINVNCYTCALSLRKPPNNEHNYTNSETFSKFLDFSNNGGLIRPSISVYKIYMETENQINFVTDGFTELSVEQLGLRVVSRVKNNLALDSSIFPNLECDNVSIIDMPHKISLIIAISDRFMKLRLRSYSKYYLQEILKPIWKRHQLTNIIL